MKKLPIIVFCFLASWVALGQDNQVTNLVEQGVELHKQGRYNEALAKYGEALEIDPNYAYANYEKAYTYFVLGEHSMAITHCERVLEVDSEIDYLAYVVLGSSLNMSGNPEKAIETFERAIAKYPNENLLHYNHSLTCFQQGLYQKAKDSAINGILTRAGHASSHLILAYTMNQMGDRIKAMMPLYFFLYLEPSTNRSYKAYSILDELIFKGVERKDEKNINLTISKLDDSAEFAQLEMFVSLLAASRFTEEKQGLNDLEYFAFFTEGFLGMLNVPEFETTSFWHEYYIPFFNDLKSSGNIEAFSYYLLQSVYPEMVLDWVESNPEKLEAFFLWAESE